MPRSSAKHVGGVLGFVLVMWCVTPAAFSLAHTFYVAPAGSDATSCDAARSLDTPKHTIAAALGCLTQPGETIAVREGVYAESLSFGAQSTPLPVGLSGNAPLTIHAYEDERVVLRPGVGDAVIHVADADVPSLLIQGLELDATGVATGVRIDGAHEIRLNTLTIWGANGSGVQVVGSTRASSATHSLIVEGLDLHHNGQAGITVDDLSIVIQDSQIHENGQVGLALTGLTSDPAGVSARVWNNRIWRNGTTEHGWGIQVQTPTPTIVYGNVVWQHATGVALHGHGPTSHRILNNTILGPGVTGLLVRGTSVKHQIYNNISVGHQSNSEIVEEEAGLITHNLFDLDGVVDWLTGDGHLRADSAAIDEGVAIESLLGGDPTQSWTDIEGQPRPLGEGWDIGAYEQSPRQGPSPTAAFTATPLSGVPPLGVNFLDQSTGTVEQWRWTFGDGATSTDRHPTHEYRRTGSYPITLTVTGPGGSDTTTHTALIAIRQVPLQAAFSLAPTDGIAPLSVKATNTSIGEIVRHGWDWGDDTRSQQRQPRHTFTRPGLYHPQLTVYGPQGETVTRHAAEAILVRPSLGSTLLHEDFTANDLTNWEVVDEGTWQGPSQWEVAEGRLVQRANIWSPPAHPAHLAKPGTMLWYRPGEIWTDYRVQVAMQSADDDTLGVLFRYQDPDNYYRFSWDCERGLRRLVKRTAGQTTLLADDHVPYTRGKEYHVQIDIFGSVVQVQVDDTPIFTGPVVDADQPTGSVGLYTWLNNASQFDNLKITEFQMPTRRAKITGGSRQ